MSQAFVLLTGAALIVGGCALTPILADPGSDAPERRPSAAAAVWRPDSYGRALASWRTPEDVNAWIGATFEYDDERAVALSESQRAAGPAPHILAPSAFFDRPRGVCVDLARFAVETLKTVAPELKPRYLMIEFDPARLRGQVLRRHWVAAYEGPDGLRIIGDSKRPGFIAGPYRTLDDFIGDYARYRGRDIVSYRELESYQRKLRQPRARQQKGDA
ncbi:MAG: hypothetical protein QM750_24685 [Rubrivivax sp.]